MCHFAEALCVFLDLQRCLSGHLNSDVKQEILILTPRQCKS